MTFRVAGMRQVLGLDTTPTATTVIEFAEHLQAEAEQLMLTTPNAASTVSTPSSTVVADLKKKDLVKAAALTTPPEKEKPRCRFWGTAVGCKKADSCAFVHSWDGIEKKGRCWNCSAEGHLRPECPYPKNRDSSGSPTNREKISKIAAPKANVKKDGSPKHGKGDTTSTSPTAPLRSSSTGTLTTSSTSSSAADDKGKTKIVEEKPVTPEALMSDLSSLVKSLQGLKAIQLRYVEAKVMKTDGVKVALVDGGATHALRRGTRAELALRTSDRRTGAWEHRAQKETSL